jgi:ZIP family zinc transporter
VGVVQVWDLALTGVPVVAAGSAGVAATVRRPGARLTSGLQHFAAGVVIAAAALELLPDVVRESGLVSVVGFGAGIVVMFTMRAVTSRLEERVGVQSSGALPAGMIGATAVDFLIDGLILGAGFTAGGHTGILLTIALAIEYLFVSLSLAGAMGDGARVAHIAGVPVLLSLLTVGGALLGVWLLAGVSATVLAGVLAFGAVAFMYLATEELLVEAHVEGETAIGSSAFYVGFLAVLVIEQALR